jgi:hypothetical protein
MAETKVFTMRMDEKLLAQIDELNDRRYRVAGGTKGKPPTISRAETIRWLLSVGMEEVSKDLDRTESKLKGGRR